MTIVYVTAAMPYGHGEEFLLAEARELVRRNVELIIVPRSCTANCCNDDNANLINYSEPQTLFSLRVLWNALLEFISNPSQCLKALKLILSSCSMRSLLYNLAVFPKGLWLSRLVTNRKVDHIHAHWASTTATLALIASTVSRVPWSLTAHRGDIVSGNLLSLKMQRASFVRFISESGAYLAQNCGVNLSNVTHKIIHMGVDIPADHCCFGIMPEVPVILCPASFVPVKGHKFLLHAIAELQQRGIYCTLKLAGEGPLHNDLRNEAERLGIGNIVEFLGQLPHDRLLNMYKQGNIDLVVMPSLDLGNGLHEGIPVALVEAMGYSIPVVSTLTGGIPELLKDGAGILVTPGDSLALAQAIQTVIKNDAVRHSLTLNGRNRIIQQYDVENVVSQLLNSMQCMPEKARW